MLIRRTTGFDCVREEFVRLSVDLIGTLKNIWATTRSCVAGGDMRCARGGMCLCYGEVGQSLCFHCPL